MKRFAALVVVLGVFGGCATHSSTVATTPDSTVVVPTPGAPVVVAPAPAAPAVYRGEVWTWDPTTNVVTLLQGDQKVRILVTADQLVGIKQRDFVTVRGVPAGPAPIEQVVVPSGPMRAVPTGMMDQTEVTGTITAVDPGGKISIATSRGPLDVLVATPLSAQLRPGSTVRVKSAVQGVTFVPISSAAAPASSEPAALAGGEPGDHAVVTGRILAIEPTGRITVESPRGSIHVWVADASRYVIGQSVQARTSVLASQ
jgi:hypothetical protein